MSTQDNHLDTVALSQLLWKPSAFRNIAVSIVSKIILPPFRVWPDQIPLTRLSQEDRQAVGTAWRLLSKAEVIHQTGNYRKSTATGRRSSLVFEYELKSMNRAKTFLRRNEATPQTAETQAELFTVSPPFPNN
jgi:hypothetical protein